MNIKQLEKLEFNRKIRESLSEIFDVADPKKKEELKREYRTFRKSLTKAQRIELDRMLF